MFLSHFSISDSRRLESNLLMVTRILILIVFFSFQVNGIGTDVKAATPDSSIPSKVLDKNSGEILKQPSPEHSDQTVGMFNMIVDEDPLPEYTLTVISDHGTVTKDPDQATYTQGTTVELTATPAAGWDFESWSGGATGSNNPVTITMDGNKIVTANYILHEYILEIAIDGSGTVAKNPDQETYHLGDQVQLTATPAEEWNFIVWVGDVFGSDNPITLTIDENPSVTAYFTQNEYLLTVEIVGNGTVSRNPNQGNFHKGDEVTLTANPANGWTFAGWSGDLTGSENPATITIEGETNITATFTQNEYNLDVTIVGNGSVTKNPDKTTYHYGDVVTLTALANTGWHFVDYSGDLTSTSNIENITINGNKAVTATFEENPPNCYALTLNHTGQGSNPVASPTNSENCTAGLYVAGEAISLSGATPSAGWHVSGWTGTDNNASTASTNTFTMPANAHTASVIYEKDTVTLTVNITGSGTVSQNPEGPYLYGDVVELTANPAVGWHFENWSGDTTGTTNPKSITLNGSKIVTAVFVENPPECYSLTLSHTGEGSNPQANPTNSDECPTGSYVAGANIILFGAEPSNGWHISSWTGTNNNASTDATNFVTMPASNHEAGVNYERDSVTLTVNVSGNGSVSRDNNGPYLYGDVVQLTANPTSGWHFENWSGDMTGSENPKNITLNGNKTVTANFAENTPNCFALTLIHSGQGNNPVASPTNSTGCPSGQYVEGQAINLSGAAPSTGWHISGWTGTSNNSSTASTNSLTMPASNHSASVVYVRDTVTLTVNVSGSGSVNRDDNGPYEYGDVVQLTAVPATGWHFVNWTGDLTGSENPKSITLNGNRTVTAVFEEDAAPTCYTLTLSHSGQGSDPVASPTNSAACPADQYVEGEAINLSGAMPDTGWHINGWTGTSNNSSTASTNSLSMPASSHSASVIYVRDTVTLTVNISGSGSVSRDDNGPYEYGDVVELTANPGTGWHFVNWTDDLTGSENPKSITRWEQDRHSSLRGESTELLFFDPHPYRSGQ